MITITNFFSEGVSKEQNAWTKYIDQNRELLKASSPAEYATLGDSVAPFHYERLISPIPPGACILDVGVGAGQSSMFLASHGYKVYALEPVFSHCQLIEEASEKYSTDVHVVHGVAEDISKLNIEFDAIFFNASLHHCDDIPKALKASHDRLKPGGKIFLVNENFLRPWQSHQWFEYMLENHPDEIGHYGGNEHSYHNWEYSLMLKQAGFASLTLLPPASKSAIEKIEFILSRRVDKKRVFTRARDIVARLIFYSLLDRIGTPKLLMRMSLLQCHFVATK